MNVVLDSDFLSAFLKIEALDSVRESFGTDTLLVPAAVFREVAVTTLLPRLTSTKALEVRDVPRATLDAARSAAPRGFDDLGAGEREAIALAHQLEDSVLLMNDRKALRSARMLQVRGINVPAFLLLYRSLGDTQAAAVPKLVEALEAKDHYGFPEKIRRRLLGEQG